MLGIMKVDLGIKEYKECVNKVKIYYHTTGRYFDAETLYLDEPSLRKLRDAVQGETFESMGKRRAFVRLATHKGAVDLNLCNVFKISYFEFEITAPKDKNLLALIRAKMTFESGRKQKDEEVSDIF